MTDEPDKTEDTEPTAEETEAAAEETVPSHPAAAEATDPGTDAPEGDAVEEEKAAPKPRRRRRRAPEPTAEAEEAAAEPQAETDEPEAAEPAEPADQDEPEAAEEAPEEPARPARSAGPTPSRRRAPRDPDAAVPVVRAQAKYVRSSARKARLVCDHIRGKSVEEARAILALTPRAIAQDWSKLLESAVANAEHNHELVGEDLYVKSVHADEGPTIKRFRPRAMGRATRIRKRTSHLTILLTPKD
jgi:ribosomal protein L22